MGATSRLTISLPAELVDAIDDKLAQAGETRSAVVRRLVRDALHKIEEQEQIEQYIKAYEEQPQTEEEFGFADALALEYFKENPWP